MEKNKDILDEIELRSENVQDILTRPPHWLIRWGNTIIFSILLMVLLMSYLIKYPDFVSAPIIVTSQNPPEKLEARTNSKIEKILVKDHQSVNRNQVLMVLQSAANYKDILILKRIIDSISPSQVTSFPIEKISTFKLGEIQGEYNSFAKALQDERLFTRLKPYAPENIAVNQTLGEYRARIATLQQQRSLELEKFDLTKKNYLRSQELFDQGVIAATELENEKIKFLQADQDLKNISISLSQVQEAISNLHKTKIGASISTEKDKITYSSQTLQLFEQLRKALRQWEQNYLITSSTEGKVSFQQFWGENQFVKPGDIVMSVMPQDKDSIIGRMLIPSINSGKVKPNQKVLIKLDNYRYQEYGVVDGKVQNISLTPDNQGNYYVDITLPKGLKTSFNKELSFDKELKGNAEIVTQDLRLIERFFYQIMQLMRYQS